MTESKRKKSWKFRTLGLVKYEIRLLLYYTLEYNVPEFEAVMLRLRPKKNNTRTQVTGCQLFYQITPQQGCRRQQCPALLTTWHLFSSRCYELTLVTFPNSHSLNSLPSSRSGRKLSFHHLMSQLLLLSFHQIASRFKVLIFVFWRIREISTLPERTYIMNAY